MLVDEEERGNPLPHFYVRVAQECGARVHLKQSRA
jgi:hypothetical protein